MRIVTLAAVLAVALMTVACSTKEQGVKSNYMTQWTTVAANTKTTTDAAKAVLENEGLKDVKASSTSVDGHVSAKKADDTKVSVSVKKESDTSSEVSVNVGTMGDPALGADWARKIKDKAEAK